MMGCRFGKEQGLQMHWLPTGPPLDRVLPTTPCYYRPVPEIESEAQMTWLLGQERCVWQAHSRTGTVLARAGWSS